MSLIKLATNKMTALMQVGKLSKNAIHSINWRPAEQIAGGLERGNIVPQKSELSQLHHSLFNHWFITI